MQSQNVAAARLQGATSARRAGRVVARGAAVIGFALLTWAGARIAVPLPFTPVPATLQTVSVLLAGLCLGAGRGAASQVLYLTLGLLGLPVFALPGAGPAYLLGPTGGYLAGFVAAAWVIGRVNDGLAGRGAWRVPLALLAGSAALHLCGLAWLVIHTGGDPAAAVRAGIVPFLLFDLAKIAVVTGAHAAGTRLGRALRGAWTGGTTT